MLTCQGTEKQKTTQSQVIEKAKNICGVCVEGEEGRRVYSHFLGSNTDGDLIIFSILGAFHFPTPLLLQS